MPFWFALAAVAAVAFVMHRTLFGRYCYAIGSNAEAARLSGVPVTAIRLAHLRRQRVPRGRRRHLVGRVPAGRVAGSG